mgnify:CR=1 FL=1
MAARIGRKASFETVLRQQALERRLEPRRIGDGFVDLHPGRRVIAAPKRPALDARVFAERRLHCLDHYRACDRGTKCNAQGYKISWNGYKLHIDTADCGVVVSALTHQRLGA